MTFTAVTTCSAQGWREYGKRMLDAYKQFWPLEVPLTLYSEDDLAIDATRFPGWLHAFRAKHGKNRVLCGYPRRANSYDYRFDSVRFAYKTAAVIDAAWESEADYLIWVDADTVTHSPVTLEFLAELAPEGNDVISWLHRSTKYPECGFYILNLRNSRTPVLLREWQGLYTSDHLFHLPEWHDSFVLQELVKSLRCNWKSISGAGEDTHHPFINGPLGSVMDHMKGPRKSAGRSGKRDLKIVRDEVYWKGTR